RAYLLSFRAERSGVEESRDVSFKVSQRDVSTSLDMTGLFQFRQLSLDVVEIGQLPGVIVALRILDHAVLIDNECRRLWHTALSEVQLRQTRDVHPAYGFSHLM